MITGRQIASTVAEEFGLTFKDLKQRTRRHRISHPRQAAMYAVRQIRPNMSYPMIGRLFGGRDHTTVMHGLRQVQRRIDRDETYKAKIDRVLTQIGGAA